MRECWRKGRGEKRVDPVLSTALDCGGLKGTKDPQALRAGASAAKVAIETKILMISETISHYRIVNKLGAGGMGEVYLAEDTKLNRKVAIKFLPAELTADEQAKKRLVREAQAAARLDHPNICSIYEVAEEEGRSFIVMQYVEGETLAKLIQRKPLDLRESLDIAAKVADALAEAHAHQIIHRDIKPQNVMITARGQVKVLDFGLAKVVRERSLGDSAAETASLLTDSGMIIGTVPYMSPEQVRGEALDARSDIFSFGSVLYEMMSGICPFAAQSAAATVSSILTREPPPLARYSREMPEALEWIVSKALRKDREQRYQTAKDLLIDLKNLKYNLEFEAELERSKDTGSSVTQIVTSAGQMVVDTAKELAAPTGEVAAARTTSSVGHLFSQANQHKRAVALALGAIAALAALWYLVPRPGSGTKEAPKPIKNVNFTQLTDQPGQEYFPSLSPDGKSLIYVSRASGNWDIYLQRVGGRNPTNLTKDSTTDDTQPAFSTDGERIVFRSEREGGGIYLMGATGESVRRVSDFGYNPVWSPDGENVLLATESVIQPSTRPTKSQLWTINVSNGDRHLITEGDALQPHWSPHGHRIAYWSRPQGGQGDVWTISADGSNAVQITSETPMDWNPVWSPDGKYLYFCSDRAGNMGLWRVPIEEKTGKLLGEAEAVTSGGGTSSQHISFAQDGRRIAYVTQEEIKNLRKVTFDPSTEKILGEPVPITRGSLQAVYPDPSPNGEWLAYYSLGKQQDIFIIRTDGSGMRQLTDDAFKDRWPHWSPDGKRIAFTSDRSGSSQIWAINRDGSGLQQLTQMAGAHYPVWSADGTQMAYSIHTPKNDCYIFRVGQAWGGQTPVALAPLSDTSQTFESWSWSPDGKRLAGIRHLADGSHVGIGVYDLESQKYDWLTDFGEWPSWFNDGRRILFANHGKIFIVDSESKKYHEVFAVADGDIGSPGLSRDNRMIYFTFVATEADIWLLDLGKGG